MKKVKIISLLLAAVLTGSVLAGCASQTNSANDQNSAEKETSNGADSSETAGEKEEVTLNLADMSVYGIAVFNFAQEIGLLDGYFDDIEGYDVNVNLSEWASGVDQNTAFAAGEIDFSCMGNIPAVTGASSGYGTEILAVNYLFDDEYVLVVRDGSGIESVADLKGKNVGTYVGTVTHYAIAKYLENEGLTLDDVNLLNVGAEATTSLRSGDIDATVLGGVVAQQLEEEGTAHVLAEENVPTYNYVVGSTEFAEKYPEITKRVLKLINDTWDYALEHQEEYLEFYAEASGNDLEIVQASWGVNFPVRTAKDFSDEDYAAYIEFVDWLKDIDYISQDVDADSLLDLTYVKELEQEEQ